ncbi:16S rRNA (guanine(527)-N(7))-methyltransferase RsmG [Streptococcus chenjunshii]|uniref:Ribosomal RNA small subunit methyltransferase G n=1 Tax=Streptococcus chenjunshii TaxID=2173853 RepID=A0A372KLX4_9STRE|nr:16S rRNA (guanine(527)-N(7))-methyltransferase RsmG [Streptococcus chenjunshii]AXQ78092.1 16S rRNA (guanine(527)-N(7))-methyltransferase RsmG [Streptococcus chenjunshii]RFU51187.1 16S rRNA (guanine(527)-N(7))-methyltransferase RsmG [Streptococcus chenjunshii]RFU53273.1 16S rRNA (guanine(527)-N(7))-methyltransferase RsmG [Streptococcus chenjunshii]
MTPEEFYAALSQSGINLSEQQKQQFAAYFNCLIEWNQKANLTAITDKNDVYLKHFYDSLAPVLRGYLKNEPIQLLDIGAGAGFPSLPIKIIYPNIKVTIIDSLNKRILFLNRLAETLKLDGVSFYHGRAEDFGHDKTFRQQFDFVTARAVAALPVLTELTLPFLKINGRLLALKAAAAEKETLQAQNALRLLFAQLIQSDHYTLPNGDGRTLVILEKKKETPNKYPRKAGTPNKKPL